MPGSMVFYGLPHNIFDIGLLRFPSFKTLKCGEDTITNWNETETSIITGMQGTSWRRQKRNWLLNTSRQSCRGLVISTSS